MSEYTPTTENLRTAWISHRLDPDRYGRENFGRGLELVAEFDRWLAGELAKAWDEGRNTSGPFPVNPYREDK